jgi:NADH:ubiquinone oxidoreductase subunit 3 (subunit A)
MGILTLIVVLAGVSCLVCASTVREERAMTPLRARASEAGRRAAASVRHKLRSASGTVVRAASATSEALLRADDLIRRSRRPSGFAGDHRPAPVAVEFRPSRLLALVELLLLAVLTGAAIAAAVAGVAWGLGRLLT